MCVWLASAVLLAMFTVLQYPHLGLRLKLGKIILQGGTRTKMWQRCACKSLFGDVVARSVLFPIHDAAKQKPRQEPQVEGQQGYQEIKPHPETPVEVAD